MVQRAYDHRIVCGEYYASTSKTSEGMVVDNGHTERHARQKRLSGRFWAESSGLVQVKSEEGKMLMIFFSKSIAGIAFL